MRHVTPRRRGVRPALLATPLLALLLLIGACSFSVGTSDDGGDALSRSGLEDDVRETLAENAGDRPVPDTVDCEGGLEAEAGAEQRCLFADESGARYGLTVTTSGVDGSDLEYDIAIDPGQAVGPSDLEPEVTSQLTRLAGAAPDSLDCPNDLYGFVGATTTCLLTDGTDRYEVAVTVTAAEEGNVRFDIEVADEPLP
ncbi:MAG: DUF4333 domain-containing protein [Nocardioides sp.]